MELSGRTLFFRRNDPLEGDDVELLQSELRRLGYEIPDNESGTFADYTWRAVMAFQRKHFPDLRESGVVDRKTAQYINAAVDGVEPEPEPGEQTISGQVISRERAGVGGLRVEIVDKNVGEDVSLAEGVTDDSGSYWTTFSIAILQRRGKQRPDLQARVFAGQRFLGASEVRYNASDNEILNVVLPEEAASGLPSEYKTLTDALSTHFRGNLRDLKETDNQQDITYLANKTGWDARAVALASLADQFSDRAADMGVAVEPAIFYALFRAGLPANETVLYRLNPRTAETIWKQAVAQGVIPVELEDRLPEVSQQFQRLAARRALDGPALVGLSSLREMLSISLGDDPGRQSQFAELYVQYQDDIPEFWGAVRDTFGEAAERRLRLDGQLAHLTLSNAPLIRRLHEASGQNGLTDTLSLVESGYYRAEKWQEAIGDGPIPSEIPGEDDSGKRGRYAELMAAEVRLSFPTAVVAQMVRIGETPLAVDGLRDQVHDFLIEQQGEFVIGMQPVEQYVAANDVQVEPEVVREVTRIQRVYQITPNNETMNVMLTRGLDSSYAVVRYSQDSFIRTFKDELGGEVNARLIHDKAQQVHNAVLNIAVSYLTASNAPGIGVHSPAQIVNPEPNPHAGDVIAYSTMETLLGEMDYCECEHCRSILSPAAYLVDLLIFCDPPTVDKGEVPQKVLLDRRPDIQHLPLTCENTNTPLPYIDLVNETLEYYVTNGLSLANYTGHNTDGSVSREELMASPQFVSDAAAAYTILAEEHFPLPLPFHQPLENLRRYFDRFEAPLPEVMEMLREDDSMERANEQGYGWRDILMEELGLSRSKYAILTDGSLTLHQLYGFEVSATHTEVLESLSNVKAFTRRMGISYEDIIEILRTRFVNPHSILIPKLERLGVSFATLKEFKDGTITDEEFGEALAPHLDEFQYGGDIKAWVKEQTNYDKIMSLITLTNPEEPDKICSFEDVEFRYTNPDNAANKVRPFEFVRLLRFIRLWKKLGWTIEQTDKAIAALYPANEIPDDSNDTVNLERLDNGFLIMLPRLGIVKRVMDKLKLKLKKDLLPLLACFAPIDTHGAASFYKQIFTAALRKEVTAFADDGYGGFLTNNAEGIAAHTDSLRAAFRLTEEEFTQIVTKLNFDSNTVLSIDNISAIFRRGWLARNLKLSVREFLLLTQFTDFDPFDMSDLTNPPILRLIKLLDRLRSASLKPVEALYLIWNQDISGRSTPDDSEIQGFAHTVRSDFAVIESEFALTDDPDGQIARAKMAMVYGSEATDVFFGFLDNTFVTSVSYDHSEFDLEQSILDAAPGRIAYDDFRKQLSYTGVMTTTARDSLKSVGGVTAQFQTAVDLLYAENQKVSEPFFSRYPELQPLYDAFIFFGDLESTVAYTHPQSSLEQAILDAAPGRIIYNHADNELSFKGVLSEVTRDALKSVGGVTAQFQTAVDNLFTANQTAIGDFFTLHPTLVPRQDAYLAASDVIDQRRSVLLGSFLPELKLRRKRQQALQVTSAGAKTDLAFASAILHDATVLHAVDDINQTALDNLTAIETPGLSAQFFFSDTATGAVDQTSDAEADLDYSATGNNKLPVNPTPGNAISGIWSGYLEVPENSFYNLQIKADPGATVTLEINKTSVSLTQSGDVWSNDDAIELRAGTLYAISLKVENVKDSLTVQWQTTGRGWEVIPAQYLYSETLIDRLRYIYTRFLKTVTLAKSVELTANEMAYLAAHSDYYINGEGWLNSLPVTGSPDKTMSTQLLIAFSGLLDFARIKANLSPNDERFLILLSDPTVTMDDPDGLLFTLTRWEPGSTDSLLLRFGKVNGGSADREALRELSTFSLVHDAYDYVKKLRISASALINAATNEPTGDTVRDLKAALQARYDESDWLDVLKPINDEMRELQRDALVAYILHQMSLSQDSEHIDTPEKLFEYFLMDTQMRSCMQTSRIRHALSSVQLFIERCLMNLETRVAPSSIDPKQWEWMKRYRVWEANRKVFLYPENWLEPELRDDQSPFFKEAMSELLQGDITEDRAAETLLNYLAKLDEVAKLEPCGIHYIEDDPDTETREDIAHVVARTAGANRKYYYRRYEYGYWTPWEHIKLDIEDDPVLPVVWKDRLFLFWLRILKQSPMDSSKMPVSGTPAKPIFKLDEEGELMISPGKEKGLADVTLSGVKQSSKKDAENIKEIVQAVLCWSEYYNGKWQSAKTSDVNKPTYLCKCSPAGDGAFRRSRVKLSVIEESGALRVNISGQGASSFLLYNMHSLPVPEENAPIDIAAKSATMLDRPIRVISLSSAILTISYRKQKAPGFSRSILKPKIDGRIIEPNHLLSNAWLAPFFYEDRRHVFYVTTEENTVLIPEVRLYIPQLTLVDQGGVTVPELVQEAIPKLTPERVPPEFEEPGFGVVDPDPMERFVHEDAYITRGLATTGTVRFGDIEIGPNGSMMNKKQGM